jgi:hypothetical protein
MAIADPFQVLTSGSATIFLMSKIEIMSNQKEKFDFTEFGKFLSFEHDPKDIAESLEYIHNKLIECVFYLLLKEDKGSLAVELDSQILEHLFELRSIMEQLTRLANQK